MDVPGRSALLLFANASSVRRKQEANLEQPRPENSELGQYVRRPELARRRSSGTTIRSASRFFIALASPSSFLQEHFVYVFHSDSEATNLTANWMCG
jgi:hypothetical protein